jgi:aspartate/methionine/tyrosine aminotransferase
MRRVNTECTREVRLKHSCQVALSEDFDPKPLQLTAVQTKIADGGDRIMKSLASNPKNMKRSGIREVMELASSMENVIHLEVGEPDFDTPPHIIEAAAKAAWEGFTHYTPNAGLLSLRERIAEKLRRDNNIDTKVDNIIVTPGAVTAAMSALMALIEPGDEVLLPDPCWPNNLIQLLLLGARVVRYPLYPDRGFLPDFEHMHELVTPTTKVIITNSPSNPSGSVLPKQALQDLLNFARRHDLYILSDEVYETIVFDEQHFSPASEDEEGRVVSIFGFSKTYAMTGWRLGYAVAPDPIADCVVKIQEPLVSCASAISQKAGEAALAGPQDAVVEMREAYRHRRDEAIKVLKKYDCYQYTPKGAFYLLLDVSSLGHDSYIVAQELLKEIGVATAPGATFGEVCRTYIRISLATEIDQLVEGVTRICKYMKS